MADAPVSFQEYWQVQFKAAHAEVIAAVAGLRDRELYFQPAPDANSVAWLVWHLYRWQDTYTAKPSGERDLWVSANWADRFEMEPDRGRVGDTPEQVRAFQPERALLMGYVAGVHQAVLTRMQDLTDEQLVQPTVYDETEARVPFWFGMIRMFNDSIQHTGQIAYLRGLISGLGWKKTLDWQSLQPST